MRNPVARRVIHNSAGELSGRQGVGPHGVETSRRLRLSGGRGSMDIYVTAGGSADRGRPDCRTSRPPSRTRPASAGSPQLRVSFFSDGRVGGEVVAACCASAGSRRWLHMPDRPDRASRCRIAPIALSTNSPRTRDASVNRHSVRGVSSPLPACLSTMTSPLLVATASPASRFATPPSAASEPPGLCATAQIAHLSPLTHTNRRCLGQHLRLLRRDNSHRRASRAIVDPSRGSPPSPQHHPRSLFDQQHAALAGQPLGIAIFCWLPPDIDHTSRQCAVSEPADDKVPLRQCRPARPHKPHPAQPVQNRQRQIRPPAHRQHQPLRLAVLRQKAAAQIHRLTRRANSHLPAVHENPTRDLRVEPEDGLGDLAAARAHQAAKPTLARPYRERHSWNRPAEVRPSTRRSSSQASRPGVRESNRDRSADHQLHIRSMLSRDRAGSMSRPSAAPTPIRTAGKSPPHDAKRK